MRMLQGLVSRIPRLTGAIGVTLFVLLLFALYFTVAPAAQESGQGAGKQSGRREKDDPIAREQWFYKQRAFPRDTIPVGARERALQRLDEMIRAQQPLGRQAASGAAAAAQGTLTLNAWSPIGPQPINSGDAEGMVAGRVTAVAVDSTDSNIVYAGGAFGGVWKSTDGGQTWTPITESQPTQAIGSIAIDPKSCSPGPCTTIYVGTGEENFAIDSYYGAGILKSTDGGNTWTQLGASVFTGPFSGGFSPGGGARIGSIAVNPGNPNIVLAAVQILSVPASSTSGIYCSGDGGNTWNPVPLQGGGTVTQAPGVDIVFASATIAYGSLGRTRTGTNSANGVYKAVSSGAFSCSTPWTLTNLANPSGSGALLVSANTGRIAIGVAPSDPNTVYAGIQNPSTTTFGALLGFFKSTNGGTSWTQLTGAPDYCNPQCWYDNVIRVHPNNPSIVYAGGSATSRYFMRSTDGGGTWTPFILTNGLQIHVDQHAMAFGFTGTTATKLYVGNDGGVYSADVSAPTNSIVWSDLNATLNITQFYPGISIHPSTPQVAIGGTQDNGTVRFSGSAAWDEVLCGDGGWTIIDPLLPSTYYVSCQSIDIEKSVQNGGAGTFTEFDTGINQGDNGSFIPPFVMDPSNHLRLYFGTYRLWQTNDAALSWSPISGDLTSSGGSASGGPTLTAIAVASSNSQFIYTGTSDGCVRVSTNAAAGSATFSASCLTGLPSRSVTHLTVDPADPNTMYVAFSGFSHCTPPTGVSPCDGLGHIFKTINAGAAWVDISGTAVPLPDTPVNDLVLDPDDPAHNTLYVATDVGVFQTLDAGNTWAAMNPATSNASGGLPRVTVQSLQLHNPSRTLRAATHGRGVWDLLLPALAGTSAFRLASIQPTAAAAGSSFLLTATGQGFTGSSVIRWNGATTGVTMQSGGSSTQLSATIDTSLLTGPGVAQITVTDPVLGTTNALPLTVSAPPANDNFVSAMAVTLGSNNKFSAPAVDSSNATTETTDPTPSCTAGLPGLVNNGRAKSVWYKWTATASGSLTVDTIGSSYDTILVAVTGAPGSFAEQACNDDIVSAQNRVSSIAFNATLGTTYFFIVSAFSGDGGQTDFNASLIPAADFSLGVAPPSANTTKGGTATYTVTVTPSGGFTGAVTLACSSIPTVLSCSAFNPTTVMPPSNGSATSAVNVTASTSAFLPAPFGTLPLWRRMPWLWPIMLALLSGLIWLTVGSRERRRKRLLAYVSFAAIVVFLALQFTGCGGAGGGGGGGGTSPRTYTITVTGTSGSLSHSANVTLVVQ